MKTFYTYIVTNRKNGVLYIGMTNNLVIRIRQHKEKTIKGFTSKYNVDRLVWFQEFEWVEDAIAKEKQLKGWRRNKKTKLIEQANPKWHDLYSQLLKE